MRQIDIGDLVQHKMSKIQIHDYSARTHDATLGVILDLKDDKALVLWKAYTEWVDRSYLLIIDKVD
jgi:hypothetical protein